MLPELEIVSFATAHPPRPHTNAFIHPVNAFTAEQRLEAAQKAGWNVFQFPAEMVSGGDLLSDSGTTTLTLNQLAALIKGDEAYGSNRGYFQLLQAMEKVMGVNSDEWEIYLFHQGRAAEHALFSHLKGEHLLIPANSFFDTTRANAEANGIQAVDLAKLGQGDIDLAALEKLLAKEAERVPLVYSTITNNANGGQPVSMKNLRAAADLCQKYQISFFLDACRFAENAWFVKEREEACRQKTIAQIVKEEFALCDGFTISFKKDGLANMGGALAIKKNSKLLQRYPSLLEKIRDHQILVEGHPTYGGISGRDIMTIAVGLNEVIKESYLTGRIRLVKEFGSYLESLNVPVVKPIGGHAVYIDIDKFFADTSLTRKDFGGIVITGLLLLKGVRLCELGAFAFGLDTPHNYVRAAVPRNKYEKEDLFYAADCVKGLYDRRRHLPKATPVSGEKKTLRHFKARFQLTPLKTVS